MEKVCLTLLKWTLPTLADLYHICTRYIWQTSVRVLEAHKSKVKQASFNLRLDYVNNGNTQEKFPETLAEHICTIHILLCPGRHFIQSL